MQRITKRAGALFIAGILALAGCQGEKGPQGAQGAPGTPGTPGDPGAQGPQGPAGQQPLTAEACAICHGTGQLADLVPFHKTNASPQLTKGSIQVLTADFTEVAGVVKPTITFKLLDPDGANIANWRSFNFTVAQLIPATTTVPEHWSAYVWRDRPGWPNGVPNSEIGGDVTSTTSPKGTLNYDAGTATYTYVYATNLKAPPAAPATAGLAPTYAATATHRIGIQVGAAPSGVTTVLQPANGAADFVPANGTAPLASLAREIVTIDACNACHGRRTNHGRRVETAYCVTCHNYDLVQADGQRADFTTFIHKMHGREKLSNPSAPIATGIVPAEITYPQRLANCDTCHKGSAGARWNTNPSRYACTTCHDTVSFVSPAPAGQTLHTGGAEADDVRCLVCHGSADIVGFHADDATAEATKFQAIIDSVTETAPGQFPKITFRIVNPTGGCTTTPTGTCPKYKLTDDPFTRPAGASRLFAIIGLGNADFQNVGSGAAFGQPISIDLLAATAPISTPDANGAYTVTSPVAIPAAATGQGTAALEGHPAFNLGAGDIRIPMKNVSKPFAITGSSATARRTVVDIAKCNKCHANLSLHGNNRTGDITTCTICHNTEATDGSRRPNFTTPGAVGVDGKLEQGIDFKHLIHSIHGNAMGGGIVVYGFGNSVNDFRDVSYPQVLSNCEACHLSGTYQAPQAAANGTTIFAGADRTGGADNLRMTKYRATCGACHGTPTQQSHIEQMGGAAGVTQSEIDAVNN